MKRKVLFIILVICLGALTACVDDNKSSNDGGAKCGFKYQDGSTCGDLVGSHDPLCDKHFNQLNDTYNSLVN